MLLQIDLVDTEDLPAIGAHEHYDDLVLASGIQTIDDFHGAMLYAA